MTGLTCSCLSDMDPQQCLASVFEAKNPLPKGAAENAILAWLLTLPEGVDPAHAAAAIGRLPDMPEMLEGEARKLTLLLQKIAGYPAERLATMSRRRRSVN